MGIKNILSLVAVIFIGMSLLTQNIYGLVAITSATWNDVTVREGGQVVPSQDRPLEFFFQSRGDNNVDLPANFQCVVYRINDDADPDPDNIQNGIDVDGDGTFDFSFSDVQQISSDNCGENTASSSISYASFGQGVHVFSVTATPLSSDEQISTDAFLFVVPPFQAADTAVGADTVGRGGLTEAKDFWTTCADTKTDGGGGKFNLQSIEYIIKGDSKIDNLKIKEEKLKLKIFSNDNNNELKAKLASGSTEEDFRINFVDTQCNYEGPPYPGGPQTAANEVGIVAETFNAWNPPIIDCAVDAGNRLYERELEYPFKITSGLNALKNADTKNIKIEIQVDRTPRDSLQVEGEVFLGKDRNDRDINLKIVPEQGPKAFCSGKSLVT